MLHAILGRPDHELSGKLYTDDKTGTRVLLVPVTPDFAHRDFRVKRDETFDGESLLPYLMDERDVLLCTKTVYDASAHDVSEVEGYKCVHKSKIKARYGNSGTYTGFIVFRRRNDQSCLCVGIPDVPRNVNDGLADTISNYTAHVMQQGHLTMKEERLLGAYLAMAQNQLNVVNALLNTTSQCDEVQAFLISRRRYMMEKMRELRQLMETSYE